MEVLVPKLIAAAEKFDMIPVRDHPYVAPQPWKEDGDNTLPTGVEPYFLRDHSGPKWILGGILCRPLITETQSGGRFSIGSIEGSNKHRKGLINDSTGIKFNTVHHCILVMDGSFEVTVEGKSVNLAAGELIYIPCQTSFKFTFTSSYAQAYIFANGGGVEKIIRTLGKPYNPPTIPDVATGEWTDVQVNDLGGDLGYTLL
jgi:mannose-6-phosphate isomerase-like protein (cupin superfamily)